MKTCPRCGLEKTIWNFYRNAARRDGLGTYCKPCEREVSRPAQVSPEGRAKAVVRARIRREQLVANFGGRCVCCGERQFEFLQFDHKDNDGAEHRRLLGRSSIKTSDVKRDPDKFQLLCANCNFAKGAHGACPHRKGAPT